MDKIRKKISSILREEFENKKNPQLILLRSILNSLEFKDDVLKQGGEIYAVGGIVRDAIMGTPSDDLDIVVRGIPYEKLFSILTRYGKAIDTSHIDDSGKKDFGSTIFISRNKVFNDFLSSSGVALDVDVMLPRKDAKDPGIKGHRGIKSDINPEYTIEDDLDRRDITINAIAMDIDGRLISNGSGIDDIKNGIIKAVSEDAFIEDPLRMLRSVRFSARYNYDWDPATVKLIRDNASLLSDKEELPRERFLKEFEKMIGKPDLGRAIKSLVDLGMFKEILGIEPKINDYSRFDNVNSVAEFSYMLFDKESINLIIPLIVKNITNSNRDINYAEAINYYRVNIEGENLDFVDSVNKMANVYNKSSSAALESSYINDEHKQIALDFKSGLLPKGEHDIAFKGKEFKDFIVSIIRDSKGNFNPREDGINLGNAKKHAIQAIYAQDIKNEVNSIRNFILKTKSEWLV